MTLRNARCDDKNKVNSHMFIRELNGNEKLLASHLVSDILSFNQCPCSEDQRHFKIIKKKELVTSSGSVM